MKKNIPIFLTLLVVITISVFVIVQKKEQQTEPLVAKKMHNILSTKSCVKPPQFLKSLHIPQPVLIDLSQKQFKGIAFFYGKKFQKVLHAKQWETFGALGTYSLDKKGNLYLVPMPYISIEKKTFQQQKSIYKLDSQTGKLSIFLTLKDVFPSANNPYGIQAITYDCSDETLWVSAIDESNYQSQKGKIYHIDIKNKKIIETVSGIDALSLHIVNATNGKFLLVGSARYNKLYAYALNKNTKVQYPAQELFTLPLHTEHIRKIKIHKEKIELQVIPFTYTLIAQTGKEDRVYYQAIWNKINKKWQFSKK